jgi:competence protein ComEC
VLKLFLLIFFLTSLLFFRFVTFYNSQPVYKDGQEVILNITLAEEPELSNKGQSFSIKTPINQIISVRAAAFPRFHEGEVLVISGKLQEKQLEKNKKIFSLYFPQINVRREYVNSVFQAATIVRDEARSLYEKTLPPNASSLLMGIVFGAKEHFPDEFLQDLRTVGVLHVIAASGMNVTFVAGALMYILGYLLRRQFALLVGIAGITFYVFLVGFQPSIVRAAIMAILAFSASLLGKQTYAVYAVFLTAFVMLLWQPSWLFDVGFQLSFLATLGILLFNKPLGFLGKFGVLRESLTTTFAAQVTTLPVLLGTFGSIGMLSLVVNAVVLWTVPILMTLGSLAVISGFIFKPLAQGLLYVSLPFLFFFEAVVSFFGGIELNFTIENPPWEMGVGYYLVLGALLLFMRRKETKAAK